MNTSKEDINGVKVKLGDKIRGFGVLECNDNFSIDLTPVVTVTEQSEILFFGKLSASSFKEFEIVGRNGFETYIETNL